MLAEEDRKVTRRRKFVLDRHPMAFIEIMNAYREGFISESPPCISKEEWLFELMFFRMK